MDSKLSTRDAFALRELVHDGVEKPTLVQVIDLRSDKDRQLEEKALANGIHDPKLDLLVAELIQLGRNRKLLSDKPGGDFNDRCRSVRGIEIAKQLYEIGGYEMMQIAYYRFTKTMPGDPASELNYVFDGVGGWMA